MSILTQPSTLSDNEDIHVQSIRRLSIGLLAVIIVTYSISIDELISNVSPTPDVPYPSNHETYIRISAAYPELLLTTDVSLCNVIISISNLADEVVDSILRRAIDYRTTHSSIYPLAPDLSSAFRACLIPNLLTRDDRGWVDGPFGYHLTECINYLTVQIVSYYDMKRNSAQAMPLLLELAFARQIIPTSVSDIFDVPAYLASAHKEFDFYSIDVKLTTVCDRLAESIFLLYASKYHPQLSTFVTQQGSTPVFITNASLMWSHISDVLAWVVGQQYYFDEEVDHLIYAPRLPPEVISRDARTTVMYYIRDHQTDGVDDDALLRGNVYGALLPTMTTAVDDTIVGDIKLVLEHLLTDISASLFAVASGETDNKFLLRGQSQLSINLRGMTTFCYIPTRITAASLVWGFEV